MRHAVANSRFSRLLIPALIAGLIGTGLVALVLALVIAVGDDASLLTALLFGITIAIYGAVFVFPLLLLVAIPLTFPFGAAIVRMPVLACVAGGLAGILVGHVVASNFSIRDTGIIYYVPEAWGGLIGLLWIISVLWTGAFNDRRTGVCR